MAQIRSIFYSEKLDPTYFFDVSTIEHAIEYTKSGTIIFLIDGERIRKTVANQERLLSRLSSSH